MTFEEMKEIVGRVIDKLDTEPPKPACIFGDCDDCADSGPIYILPPPPPAKP